MKITVFIIIKIILLTILIIIARGTYPRAKVDHLILLGWVDFLHIFLFSFTFIQGILFFNF